MTEHQTVFSDQEPPRTKSTSRAARRNSLETLKEIREMTSNLHEAFGDVSELGITLTDALEGHRTATDAEMRRTIRDLADRIDAIECDIIDMDEAVRQSIEEAKRV